MYCKIASASAGRPIHTHTPPPHRRPHHSRLSHLAHHVPLVGDGAEHQAALAQVKVWVGGAPGVGGEPAVGVLGGTCGKPVCKGRRGFSIRNLRAESRRREWGMRNASTFQITRANLAVRANHSVCQPAIELLSESAWGSGAGRGTVFQALSSHLYPPPRPGALAATSAATSKD